MTAPTTPHPGSGLEIRDVSVTYGTGARATTAVSGVDLTVARARTLALLGPSGCGKSTLLRAVAGIEPLASGTIAWDGERIDTVPTHLRGCGLMFQDGQLFTTRDVGGNVAYGLRGTPWGRDRATRRARVAEVLELVQLPGYEKRSVESLSGGQAQRVALARLLARAPRIMLFDEPLASLDRGLRERLAQDLRDLLQGQESTAVYVTHDQEEARTVADEIAVMLEGRIVQHGPAEEVLAHPVSPTVSEFLGRTWEGDVTGGAPGGRVPS